ncbi:unnamed protein product [Rhodiola kirilowii]
MARKKIREYDSKRLLKEHLKRLAGFELEIRSAQVNDSTEFTELVNKETWLSSTQLVVKPDMLFGKRGKSGLVALNLDMAQVAGFVKSRLGVEVEMSGCKAPITIIAGLDLQDELEKTKEALDKALEEQIRERAKADEFRRQMEVQFKALADHVKFNFPRTSHSSSSGSDPDSDSE